MVSQVSSPTSNKLYFKAKVTLLQLEDLEARFVVFLPSRATLVQSLKSSWPEQDSRAQFLCLGEWDGFLNLEALASNVSNDDFVEPYSSPKVRDEVTVIFWSSGTSGTSSDLCSFDGVFDDRLSCRDTEGNLSHPLFPQQLGGRGRNSRAEENQRRFDLELFPRRRIHGSRGGPAEWADLLPRKRLREIPGIS